MKVQVARVVDHPPVAVFAQVADPLAWPWGGHIEHIEGSGVGAHYRVSDRVGPHTVLSELVLTAVEPPNRIAWRTHHEAFEHRAEIRIGAHRRGARVVAVDEDEWHHAPWWTKWSARHAMRRDMQRRLAAIEAALASRGRSP